MINKSVLESKVKTINKILSLIASIDDERFSLTDIHEINTMAHLVAPQPKPVTRYDYFRSRDAVEQVFGVSWVGPHTRYDSMIGMWTCVLENGIDLDQFGYEGTGATEAAARLAAYMQLHKAQAKLRMSLEEQWVVTEDA